MSIRMMVTKAIASPECLAKLIQIPASCLLGAGVLWWVADRSGGDRGRAVIHITEPDVEIAIDSNTFRVDERRRAPIEYDLPAGQHVLLMRRGEEVLCREEFQVVPGKDTILTAYSAMREAPTPPAASPNGAIAGGATPPNTIAATATKKRRPHSCD